MPRFARFVVPDYPHHITQRGNARRDVFMSPADKGVYLGLVKEYSMHYSLKVLGFCLMTNHVHLVVVPGRPDSMARVFREVNGRYGQYRNAIDRSTGHVWQSRFYSCALEPVRLGAVLRYVELNPVRAGLVRNAEDFAASSAAIHLGAHDPLELVDLALWRSTWTEKEWAEVLLAGVDESEAIREATYGGRPLGSGEFVARLEALSERRLTRGKPGGKASATAG
jgi:putative transposase